MDYLATREVTVVECGDIATGRDLDRPADVWRRERFNDVRCAPAAADVRRRFPVTASSGMLGVMDPRTTFGSADELAQRLGETGYLADNALATVAWLALRLGRPLLMEGEPGTGKTALAEAIAEATDLPLIRLQCYEGIDATQALYDWDFPRQILHVRALEAVDGRGEQRRGGRGEALRRAVPPRPAGPAGAARVAGRSSSSTRSTGPTTSSRRSSSRSSRRGRSPSPSWAPSPPPRRRSSSSPRTGPASCTTPSSGAASTTGSSTPAWSGSWRSSGRGRPRCPVRWPSRSSEPSTSSAPTASCSSRPASPRPSTGPGPCTSSGRASSTPRSRRRRSGVAVKYREDAERVKRALDKVLAR